MSELLIIPILNRLDAAIRKLNELLGKPEEGVPIIPPPTVIVEELNNRYDIFTINTATARTDEPLGLKDMLTKQGCLYARYMVILAVGGGFTYKLNSTGLKSLTAQIGAEHIFEIEEIYITNAAVAGTAQIFVEYRVD